MRLPALLCLLAATAAAAQGLPSAGDPPALRWKFLHLSGQTKNATPVGDIFFDFAVHPTTGTPYLTYFYGIVRRFIPGSGWEDLLPPPQRATQATLPHLLSANPSNPNKPLFVHPWPTFGVGSGFRAIRWTGTKWVNASAPSPKIGAQYATLDFSSTQWGPVLAGRSSGYFANNISVLQLVQRKWVPLGPLGFLASGYPAPALAVGSVPYIATVDVANLYGQVLAFKNSQWVPVGARGGGKYFIKRAVAKLDIAVNPVTGAPWVGVLLRAPLSYNYTVLALNKQDRFRAVGGPIFTDVPTNPAGSQSMAIASDGTAYVAFKCKSSTPQGGGACVVRWHGPPYDPSVQWELIGSPENLSKGDIPNFTGIKIRCAGTVPYVAFSDGGLDNRVVVAKLLGV